MDEKPEGKWLFKGHTTFKVAEMGNFCRNPILWEWLRSETKRTTWFSKNKNDKEGIQGLAARAVSKGEDDHQAALGSGETWWIFKGINIYYLILSCLLLGCIPQIHKAQWPLCQGTQRMGGTWEGREFGRHRTSEQEMSGQNHLPGPGIATVCGSVLGSWSSVRLLLCDLWSRGARSGPHFK